MSAPEDIARAAVSVVESSVRDGIPPAYSGLVMILIRTAGDAAIRACAVQRVEVVAAPSADISVTIR